jgi:hypothetical protein
MAKNKQRAVSILLVLGGILVLMATWDTEAIATIRMKNRCGVA